MRAQDIVSKAIFILFNAAMIFYFIRGYFYPVETNWWIIRSGLAIMLIELISIFGVFIILDLKKKKDRKSIFSLIVIFLFAFVICFLFNSYMLLLFFSLTMLSKFFITTTEHYEKETKFYISVSLAFILSLFLSLIFSQIGNYFPEQQELLRNAMIEDAEKTNTSISGEIVDNPAYMLSWGVLHYLLLILFQTFKIIGPHADIMTKEENKLI